MTETNPRIAEITLRHVQLPLTRPYWSMITTLYAFDTLIVEVTLDDGQNGFGEAVIVQGYGHETLADGWSFCEGQAAQWLGHSVNEAKAGLRHHLAQWPHAVTCLVTALEMAQQHVILQPMAEERRIPLLGAIASHDAQQIPDEVERAIDAGYRVLKVKVGQDKEADLRRVRQIQHLCAGRAKIRLDANQGYSPEDAVSFVQNLEPDGIELFEQGCAAENWDAAVAIKRASRVPIMLDESIFGPDDIDRAAELAAADLIKLKLTKCGGLSWLIQSLEAIEARGMTAVLGNGVATDLGNWMEACVAHACVKTTNELNGFTRLKQRWIKPPLRVDRGDLILPAGYVPEADRDALRHHTVRALTLDSPPT